MNLEEAKSLERRANIFLGEIFIYFACVFMFPLKTIRILAFKWLFWIQKQDREIKEYQEQY